MTTTSVDGDSAASLSERLVRYYREVLAVHTLDPAMGVCRICRVRLCGDWRFAWERLVSAGERLENTAGQLPLPTTAVGPDEAS